MSQEKSDEIQRSIVFTTEKDFAAFEKEAIKAGRIPVVLEAAPEILTLKRELLNEVRFPTSLYLSS